MEIQKVKLQLIQKILDTSDPEILNAINKLLAAASVQMPKEENDLLNLLQAKTNPDKLKDEDLRDLQQSINDAFNASD